MWKTVRFTPQNIVHKKQTDMELTAILVYQKWIEKP